MPPHRYRRTSTNDRSISAHSTLAAITTSKPPVTLSAKTQQVSATGNGLPETSLHIDFYWLLESCDFTVKHVRLPPQHTHQVKFYQIIHFGCTHKYLAQLKCRNMFNLRKLLCILGYDIQQQQRCLGSPCLLLVTLSQNHSSPANCITALTTGLKKQQGNREKQKFK